MSKLPRLSGRQTVLALEKAGFVFARQRGSHIVLRRGEPVTLVVVPDHHELDTGTLRSIIRHAGISIDDFLKLL